MQEELRVKQEADRIAKEQEELRIKQETINIEREQKALNIKQNKNFWNKVKEKIIGK